MTSLFGICLAIIVTLAAALLHGSMPAFINASGLMIVVLGTLATTIASFRRDEILMFPSALFSVLFSTRIDPELASRSVVQLAQKARRDGALSLQTLLPSLETEPYLHRAVGMVIDGTDHETIKDVLAMEQLHADGHDGLVGDVMTRAAQTAPALGLIGTLIGLVQMLGKLDDPQTLGPAMAVALLTTFYGAFLAHIVFYPIAGMADRQKLHTAQLNAIYAAAAASMARRENPKTLEIKLDSIVPGRSAMRTEPPTSSGEKAEAA